MKKIIKCSLVFLMAFSLCACNSDKESSKEEAEQIQTAEKETETENETEVQEEMSEEDIKNPGVKEEPYQKQDVSQEQSNPVNKEETSQKSVFSTNASDYGLDGNNAFVKAAMNHVGKGGICQDVANAISDEAGYPANAYGVVVGFTDWNTVNSKLKIGDAVWYHNLNGQGIDHVAVYLGNGLCLHGNWTNGLGAVASVFQNADSYTLYRYQTKQEASSTSDDTQSQTGFSPEMCEGLSAVDHTIIDEIGSCPDDLLVYCSVEAPDKVDWAGSEY